MPESAATSVRTQGEWAEKHVTDSHRAWLSKGEGGDVVFDRTASIKGECTVIDFEDMDGAAMFEALQRDGFFRLVNHGLPAELVEGTLSQAEALFNLRDHAGVINDIQVANQMRPEMKTARGYLGLLEEALNPKVGPDLKETYDFGLAVDGGIDETDHLGPNLWPSPATLPDFKPICSQYIRTAYRMSDQVLGVLLEQFHLSEGDVKPLFAKPLVVNRLIAYPPQPKAKPEEEQISMGAGSHIDYGALTVIYETAPGLEVLGADSKWTTVPHVPGSFIVMPGFCLERITNGLIQATPHRVQNHNAHKRHSSTLFLDPNPQATVAPLPAFVTKENPAQYSGCTAGHKGVLVGAAAKSTLGYWNAKNAHEPLQSAL